MWTPALKTAEESAAESKGQLLLESTSDYLGLIFAVYMISVMIGSSIFKLLTTSTRRDVLYKIPLLLHAIAFVSTTITATWLEHKNIVYGMFLVFEITVGMFYPSYGVIKSEKIPEDIRSAVMNVSDDDDVNSSFRIISFLDLPHTAERLRRAPAAEDQILVFRNSLPSVQWRSRHLIH